ncbi:hypothetical protein MMC26_003498 [Xylographa opegraphella]|nr:hypothetical protein [Xylographa opegraphella]
MQDVEDLPVVPKTEHSREGSISSIDSDLEPELDGPTTAADNVQVQKRKGGRKPIYATSEERKQRNRQAQAAFRERRTEYIKQLENNIKQQDEALHNLQQSHRSAADECLMLRYKNSLLERILLEKGKLSSLALAHHPVLSMTIGIDVQAELKTKEESTQSAIPSLSVALPTPAQRAVLNRHHQVQRGNSGNVPRLIQAQKSRSNTLSSQSPQLQPTPVSQTSSPTTSRSPIYVMQGGMTSPRATNQAQHQFQQQQLQQPLRPAPFSHSHAYPTITIPHPSPGVQNLQHGMASVIADDGRASASGSRPSQWSSSYQTHMEQLGKLTRPLLPSFLYRALFVLD